MQQSKKNDDDSTKSPSAVQRKFKYELGQDHPHINSIKRWLKNFIETGSIFDGKRLGRSSIDEETVDAVRVVFHRRPRKSIRVASNVLAIPRSTVHKVLHERLRLHAYKLFKLLSRMIALTEQLLQKKFFSALMMTVTTLNAWFSQTNHLFMYPGKSTSITSNMGITKSL